MTDAAKKPVKIEITTDREPWVNGAPQAKGEVVECDAAVAELMIEREFAKKA